MPKSPSISLVLRILFVLTIIVVEVSATNPPYLNYHDLAQGTEVTVGETKATIHEMLTPAGREKTAVYTLSHLNGKTLDNHDKILKIYHGGGTVSDKEKAALQAVGQYVDSGSNLPAEFTIPDQPHNNMVIMNRVQGKPLTQIFREGGDQAQRQALVQEWKPRVAEAAARLAREKGIYHNDLHPDNVIIDDEGNVHLIDFDNYHARGSKDFLDDPVKIQSKMFTWESAPYTDENGKFVVCGRDTSMSCGLPVGKGFTPNEKRLGQDSNRSGDRARLAPKKGRFGRPNALHMKTPQRRLRPLSSSGQPSRSTLQKLVSPKATPRPNSRIPKRKTLKPVQRSVRTRPRPNDQRKALARKAKKTLQTSRRAPRSAQQGRKSKNTPKPVPKSGRRRIKKIVDTPRRAPKTKRKVTSRRGPHKRGSPKFESRVASRHVKKPVQRNSSPKFKSSLERKVRKPKTSPPRSTLNRKAKAVTRNTKKRGQDTRRNPSRRVANKPVRTPQRAPFNQKSAMQAPKKAVQSARRTPGSSSKADSLRKVSKPIRSTRRARLSKSLKPKVKKVRRNPSRDPKPGPVRKVKKAVQRSRRSTLNRKVTARNTRKSTQTRRNPSSKSNTDPVRRVKKSVPTPRRSPLNRNTAGRNVRKAVHTPRRNFPIKSKSARKRKVVKPDRAPRRFSVNRTAKTSVRNAKKQIHTVARAGPKAMSSKFKKPVQAARRHGPQVKSKVVSKGIRKRVRVTLPKSRGKVVPQNLKKPVRGARRPPLLAKGKLALHNVKRPVVRRPPQTKAKVVPHATKKPVVRRPSQPKTKALPHVVKKPVVRRPTQHKSKIGPHVVKKRVPGVPVVHQAKPKARIVKKPQPVARRAAATQKPKVVHPVKKPALPPHRPSAQTKPKAAPRAAKPPVRPAVVKKAAPRRNH